jgi:hypothetical protein
MTSFKLRKAQTLGALSAEDDRLLEEAFVDAGYLGALLDTADPRFLVLGRTGAGKTALLRRIRRQPDVGSIDPEELSMQHLHNSTLLPKLVQAGVNLDVFYKYLWRHVCVLELIRARYQHEEDLPGTISRLLDLSLLLNKKKKEEQRRQEEAKKAAIAYLDDFGAEYWVRADTRIKKITEQIESKIAADERVAAAFGSSHGQLSFSIGEDRSDSASVTIEQEVVDRAQTIVSDLLISDLAKTVRVLGEHGFSDEKNKRYIIIDDLDKNWMPNSGMYIGLVKALLQTVRELNRQLPAAKIIVGLRSNVFKRVFGSYSTLEPQREKWLDVQLPIEWKDDALVELVDKRLAVVARGEYTKDAPRFADLLPQERGKRRPDPAKYVLERTLKRPRDLLDFLNTCIRINGAIGTLTWGTIRKAESEYSQRRLNALVEEWRGTYDGIERVIAVVGKLGRTWKLEQLSDALICEILNSAVTGKDGWLSRLADGYLSGRGCDELRAEIVAVLLEVGFLLGEGHVSEVMQATDPMVGMPTEIEGRSFSIHKMFWCALGLADWKSATLTDAVT